MCIGHKRDKRDGETLKERVRLRVGNGGQPCWYKPITPALISLVYKVSFCPAMATQ